MQLRTQVPKELLNSEDRKLFDKAVTELQVRTWFYAIKKASGLSTNQIARLFPSTPRKGSGLEGAESGYLPSESGYWDQIRCGRHLPLRRKHGRELVDLVEQRFAGTRKWIVSSLWRLLSTCHMELGEIYQLLEELPPSIQDEILIRSEIGSIFIRTPSFPKDLYRKIDVAARPLFPHDSSDTFDRIVGGAIGALALIREAEHLQNQPQHVLGRKAFLKIVERFDYFSELPCLASELQRLGRARFGSAIYSPDGTSAYRLNL